MENESLFETLPPSLQEMGVILEYLCRYSYCFAAHDLIRKMRKMGHLTEEDDSVLTTRIAISLVRDVISKTNTVEDYEAALVSFISIIEKYADPKDEEAINQKYLLMKQIVLTPIRKYCETEAMSQEAKVKLQQVVFPLLKTHFPDRLHGKENESHVTEREFRNEVSVAVYTDRRFCIRLLENYDLQTFRRDFTMYLNLLEDRALGQTILEQLLRKRHPASPDIISSGRLLKSTFVGSADSFSRMHPSKSKVQNSNKSQAWSQPLPSVRHSPATASKAPVNPASLNDGNSKKRSRNVSNNEVAQDPTFNLPVHNESPPIQDKENTFTQVQSVVSDLQMSTKRLRMAMDSSTQADPLSSIIPEPGNAEATSTALTELAELAPDSADTSDTTKRTSPTTASSSNDESRPASSRTLASPIPIITPDPGPTSTPPDQLQTPPTQTKKPIPSTSETKGKRVRRRWSEEEVDALLEGLTKYGHESSRWKRIKDHYPTVLQYRTPVDLKDKHRNLQKYGHRRHKI